MKRRMLWPFAFVVLASLAACAAVETDPGAQTEAEEACIRAELDDGRNVVSCQLYSVASAERNAVLSAGGDVTPIHFDNERKRWTFHWTGSLEGTP